MARLASGAGSRAAKYRHLLAEALPMSGAEQAVMCVLMLRGAQTPGELKQRTERMHAFAELDEVQETLERADRARPRRAPGAPPGPEGGALRPAAAATATRPRLREPTASRAPSPVTLRRRDEPAAPARADEDLRERVARLEREVAELRGALGPAVSGDAA